MAELAAFVYALVKGSTAIRDIFLTVVDMYHAEMDRRYENQSIKVQREREATVAALKQPGLSDENRAVLRRRLWELHKL